MAAINNALPQVRASIATAKKVEHVAKVATLVSGVAAVVFLGLLGHGTVFEYLAAGASAVSGISMLTVLAAKVRKNCKQDELAELLIAPPAAAGPGPAAPLLAHDPLAHMQMVV